ncbi:hypothetical protein HG15A2_33330 [Adhaeretor mobilis]|uniref:Uncharacterized protein n=2 Tax=Adhaeretor mobilis TaxID=1930276 RepID=A0A517MYV6_9BACT|nr:hypothetical protein HG15A2_33330 [Adhaeretor mobilis]
MLPPIPVNTEALAEFGHKLSESLHELEDHHGVVAKLGPSEFRKSWQPKPNKPR